MTPREARLSFPPEGFQGQCSCFPDRILGPKGWAELNPHCRYHDWQYRILGEHRGQWSTLEWDRHREWADAALYAGVVLELQKAWGRWVGKRIAKVMWQAVRSKLGEAAAKGTW